MLLRSKDDTSFSKISLTLLLSYRAEVTRSSGDVLHLQERCLSEAHATGKVREQDRLSRPADLYPRARYYKANLQNNFHLTHF